MKVGIFFSDDLKFNTMLPKISKVLWLHILFKLSFLKNKNVLMKLLFSQIFLVNLYLQSLRLDILT